MTRLIRRLPALALLLLSTLLALSAGAGSNRTAPIDDTQPVRIPPPDLNRTPPAAPITRPYYFAPTPEGWPGEIRDERDIAPYLAYQQAHIGRQLAPQSTIPTANQGKYDVTFYDLDLTLTPSTATVSGSVTIRARVTNGPITTMDLDLKANLTVTATMAGGVAVTNSRSVDVLTVNLNRSYANGELVDVKVTYSGTPTGGYFNFNTNAGQPMIWSLSEPYGARTWWPSKDYPDDKADSVDFKVHVPSTLITASNGKRIENTIAGGIATTKWKERYPIATYLVFVTSHPYTVTHDWYVTAMGDSVPLDFYIFPASVSAANPINAMVKQMMAAYRPYYGEYPFKNEKYGHAQFLFSGGMEHQTNTCLGVYQEFVTAHELGHQWWGDNVTCRDFHHVWLNEGFATFTEALWAEAKGGGIAAFHDELDFNKYFGAGTVWCPTLDDDNRIFDSNLSYNKASWVLAMLRGILGDTDFFASLQYYRAQHQLGTATTEDFRDACEHVSGKWLHPFFQEWIYGEYYPAYAFNWTTTPSGGGYDVNLNINQTQSWQIFNMPITMRVATSGGNVDFVVQDSLAAQSFTLHVANAVSDVTLDPDQWILRTVDAPLGVPQFDRSILVVNGVDWATYGSEITNAYTAKAFWGDYAINFWDFFDAPGGGYPGTLPAPLGHGAVPVDVLRHYRNVVWVGNNFNGDLSGWYDTAIASYLAAGGNVLLLTRMGDSFLTPGLQDYLGVNWTITGTTVNDCIAFAPGLTTIARTGTQNLVPVFSTTLTHPDGDLLYRAVSGFTPAQGLGVLRRPSGGGTYRLNGGRFILLSGRPYRWNSTNLKTNVMYMLLNYFFEPIDQSGAPDRPVVPDAVRLLAIRPNPMTSSARIGYALPAPGEVRLTIVSVAGRLVRHGLDAVMPAGEHEWTWDGLDDSGRAVAAGQYYAVLDANGQRSSQRLVRVR